VERHHYDQGWAAITTFACPPTAAVGSRPQSNADRTSNADRR
jgi:hypothetical protein